MFQIFPFKQISRKENLPFLFVFWVIPRVLRSYSWFVLRNYSWWTQETTWILEIKLWLFMWKPSTYLLYYLFEKIYYLLRKICFEKVYF